MPPVNMQEVRARATELAHQFADVVAVQRGCRALIGDYATAERRFNPRPQGESEADFMTPAPVLRTIIQAWRQPALANPTLALQLAQELWNADTRQERRLAAELLGLVGPQAGEATLALITSWLPQITSAATADALAEYGLGPLMLSNPPLYLEQVQKWILAPHKWTRRFAVASLLPLAHDRRWDDLPHALEVIRLVMADPELEVRQKVVAILQALIPKSPVEIKRFLCNYAVRANYNTRWIVRAAMSRLPAADQKEIIHLLRA